MKMPNHGGDIETFRTQYGCVPLDFSANTNPFGISPLAREAIVAALSTADRYPDPQCRALCAAIAAEERLPLGFVHCGNGAADLIFRLTLATRPRTALLTAPTFSEYGAALAACGGCRVEKYFLAREQRFALDDGILPRIQPGLDLLVLCEPNNPTGMVSAPALLRRIAWRCGETGTTLLVDECFNGFLSDPAGQSLVGLTKELPQLVVLKAFTKLYGMAGVRLGYMLCGDSALLRRVEEMGQAWPVSALAQAAGVAALQDREYVVRTRELIAAQRRQLAGELAALGMDVYPSDANFLLFYSEHADLANRMAERGVLLRDCSNYERLGAGFFRVAVRREEENRRLLAALADAL